MKHGICLMLLWLLPGLAQAAPFIHVDVAENVLILYEQGEEVRRYAVGIGKSSTPSPLGEWKIISRQKDWGGGFGTRWLGLNVPWGIYGIHGTNHPESIGYASSHGCIRMRNAEVEDLYERVTVGTRVVIMENGRLYPRDFSGPRLQTGDTGQNVVYLQSRLKELGLILDYADGRFGAMTELAVKYFQVWNGLEADGIASRETYLQLGMVGER